MILTDFDKNSIRNFLQLTASPKYNLYPKITQEEIHKHNLEALENSFKHKKLFISRNKTAIEAIVSYSNLEWDSFHFGYKCAIIDQYFFNKQLESKKLINAFNNIISDIITYAKSEKVKFISISINSWDIFISNVLLKHNFNYILTWVDGIINPSSRLPIHLPEHEINFVKEYDVSEYQTIAENNYFNGGRFFLDKNFDSNKVKKMYSALVYNSFINNDIMLSYKIGGKPVGLFICKKILEIGCENRIKIAPLRFLVIRKDVRHKNIGHTLFTGTINYLMNKCDLITTGFEVHNLKSMNLHSKLNFKFNNTHNVFHLWIR